MGNTGSMRKSRKQGNGASNMNLDVESRTNNNASPTTSQGTAPPNGTGERRPLQLTRSLSLRPDGDTLTTLLPQYYDVDWSKQGELGRGHYAVVFRGRNKATNQPVAIKRIKRALARPLTLKTEIRALRKVKGHPNIVQLYDVYYNNEFVVLVLELLAGGELFDRIVKSGAYSERDASMHFRKITSALHYMHQNGIVHRDLKPENLVLVDARPNSDIKISDFGLSKILNDSSETMATVCGTRAYSAPEVNFGGPARSGKYNEKVDSWSLGVILYVVLAAYHPFDPFGDRTDPDIWDHICRNDWNFEDEAWDAISDEAKDLIQHLLTRNPQKRYSTTEILNHRWITQYNALPATPVLLATQTTHGRSLRNLHSAGNMEIANDNDLSQV